MSKPAYENVSSDSFSIGNGMFGENPGGGAFSQKSQAIHQNELTLDPKVALQEVGQDYNIGTPQPISIPNSALGVNPEGSMDVNSNAAAHAAAISLEGPQQVPKDASRETFEKLAHIDGTEGVDAPNSGVPTQE